MHFALSRHRNPLADDRGNATLGFALVAPLLVISFIAILQIVMVTRERTVLAGASRMAVRVASAANATTSMGVKSARDVLGTEPGSRAHASITVLRTTSGGVHYVQAIVSEPYAVTWLSRSVTLTATVRAIDESAL